MDVRLDIGEAREARELRLAVWVTPGELDEPACQPGISEIVANVRIPRSMLSQVNESNLFAVVSCEGLEDGMYEIVPQLLFPEAPDAAIGAVSFDPETVITVVGSPPETTTPAWQPADEAARRSSGDASRLNRAASRRSALRFGRNTPGIPPSRALSAGRLTALGAHATSPTGRQDGN